MGESLPDDQLAWLRELGNQYKGARLAFGHQFTGDDLLWLLDTVETQQAELASEQMERSDAERQLAQAIADAGSWRESFEQTHDRLATLIETVRAEADRADGRPSPPLLRMACDKAEGTDHG